MTRILILCLALATFAGCATPDPWRTLPADCWDVQECD